MGALLTGVPGLVLGRASVLMDRMGVELDALDRILATRYMGGLALSNRQQCKASEMILSSTAETVFDRLRLLAPAPAVIGRAAPDHASWGGGESGEASWEGWGITWRREPASPVERRSWTTWVRGEGGEVRGAEPGDVLCPLAGVGRRPVRRLLMEARVPRTERAGYPVVVQGGRVLWIPGVCRGTEAVPAPGEPAVRLDVRRIGRS